MTDEEVMRVIARLVAAYHGVGRHDVRVTRFEGDESLARLMRALAPREARDAQGKAVSRWRSPTSA